MKKRVLLIIAILFVFLGCKKENPVSFKNLEFSFDNTFETSFSVKFTSNDSVYFRERWNRNNIIDSTSIPKSETNYIALLSKKDKDTLNSLVAKTQLKKYNLNYFEDYADGSNYILSIDKDSVKKTITVHSYKNVPKELDSLANWLYHWKKRAKLIETNKKITFLTSESVVRFSKPILKKTK